MNFLITSNTSSQVGQEACPPDRIKTHRPTDSPHFVVGLLYVSTSKILSGTIPLILPNFRRAEPISGSAINVRSQKDLTHVPSDKKMSKPQGLRSTDLIQNCGSGSEASVEKPDITGRRGRLPRTSRHTLLAPLYLEKI